MQLCYVDESGKADTLLKAEPDQQPVVVIGGIAVPEQSLTGLTHDWIGLKTRFTPSMLKRGRKGWLDGILAEPKGTTARRGFKARGTLRQRKNSIGYIGGTLGLIEKYDARIIGRLWVKRLDAENDGMKIYASSLQFICSAFHAGLAADERGMVVVDSQTHQHNHKLAHSMFTGRFGKNPPHPRLVDMPVFGHSENHAGLQIADFLCSAVLAPVAAAVYAGGYEKWNKHCDSGFLDIRERFGERLKGLTFDWVNARTGSETSSVVVHDPIGKRGTELLYGPTGKRRTSGNGYATRPGSRSTKRPRKSRSRTS